MIEMRLENSNIEKKQLVRPAIYVVFFLYCLFPFRGFGQTGENAVNVLVEMGFENVGWTEDDTERVYVLQNSAYRLNGIGISKAIGVIQELGLPDQKKCRIVVLDNNVPQISLCYNPIVESDSLTISRQDWDVSYDLGDTWKQVSKVKRENSSLFKVDIVVYPEFYFKNLAITQIYQVLLNLSPALEISLWKGMKFTAQVVVPVYNDGYGRLADKVHPGFITLQQVIRVPYNIWLTGTTGLFSNNRYGADLKIQHVLKVDERFLFEGRIGVTGTGVWDGFDYTYGTRKRLTWSLGGDFYWASYNIQGGVKAEQYLWGEKGVRVDLIRHFRYASIGFYAMKAEGAKKNGGFRIQAALPPYKYKRGKYGRITPSKNMGIIYNGGNEFYYYRKYGTNPSENMMQNNSFNPYYIKSELLNF